jgi:superfamily II DNA/RNA helicase
LSTENISFASLNLAPEILKALEEFGYTTPTPIQAEAIPVVLKGNDLMAGAQTGTGKLLPLHFRCYKNYCHMPARALPLLAIRFAH